MPWPYLRAKLASSWGVPPWEVDTAPLDEVVTALHILEIESDAARIKGRRQRSG